jgi:hypothetical protein
VKNRANFNIEIIYRRINFLIDDARSNNPHYDISIQHTMRFISNFTSLGICNVGSKGCKKINKNISKNAFDLKRRISFDNFDKMTTNEHQLPLKDLWDWMIENKNKLTKELVFEQFVQYPFVTITKEENSRLNKIKKQKFSPEDRYKFANIEILKDYDL